MATTTTPNLEDVIRGLAARGEISHISLVPSQKGKTWRASFAMCSKFGISYAEDTDPVKALVVAMTTAKMKPARVPKRDDHQVETIPQETVDVQIDPPSPTVQSDIDALM